MASMARPTAMLRQVCRAAPSKAAFSTAALPRSPAITKSIPQNAFAKSRVAAPVRVAAFHATSRQAILPPGPQVIQGTANDAAPVPAANPSHGSYHWTFERLISAGLIPLTIAPFAAGSLNPTTDAILCASLLIHSHIGFESMIIDYIPSKRLPKTRVAFMWALRAATVMVGVGLYEFETNDVGLTEAIKKVWTA